MHDRLIGDTIIGNSNLSRFVSSTGSPGTYRLATIGPDGEATDVPGAFNHPDQDCEAAGGILRNPADTSCRYHFVDQVSVISAEERVQVFTEFDWDFTDQLKYYAEAHYSRNTIRRSDGGGTFNTGNATGGGFTIPANHPFNFWTADPAIPGGMLWVDPAVWDNATDVAVPVRAIARPFGIDVNHNELTEDIRRQNDYIRFMNGMQYDFDNGWFIDASYSFSSATRTTDGAHNYRSDIFSLGILTYKWICGKKPFPGSNLADILTKIVRI